MFNKPKKETHVMPSNKLSSLIADNLSLHGDLAFSGGLRIDGRIEGNIIGHKNEQNLVVVSNTGRINGKVHGDLIVENLLELQANARITGNIMYQKLQMECGAVVEGKLELVESNLPPSETLLEQGSPAHRNLLSHTAETDQEVIEDHDHRA